MNLFPDRKAFLPVLLALSACVSLPPEKTANPSAPGVAQNAHFPARIAVLPVNNQAGDTDGAVILRALAIRKLGRDLGYFVQKPEDTDQIIHDRTLTGPEIPLQVALAKLDPRTLTTWLGVDGLLHGEL